MTFEEREEIISAMLSQAKEIRKTKGVEYSAGEDINALFNSENDIGIDNIQAIGLFMNKHYLSIRRFIKSRDTLSEPIETRIIDLINYLLILNTLIKIKH